MDAARRPAPQLKALSRESMTKRPYGDKPQTLTGPASTAAAVRPPADRRCPHDSGGLPDYGRRAHERHADNRTVLIVRSAHVVTKRYIDYCDSNIYKRVLRKPPGY